MWCFEKYEVSDPLKEMDILQSYTHDFKELIQRGLVRKYFKKKDQPFKRSAGRTCSQERIDKWRHTRISEVKGIM